jgi:hypothetical protein
MDRRKNVTMNTRVFARSVGLVLVGLLLLGGMARPGAAQTATPTLERIGSVSGAVTALEQANGLLYAGEGSTLSIYAVDDTGQPVLQGSLMLPALVEDLAVAGTTAYLALGTAGFFIVDVANPAAPVVMQHLPLFASDPDEHWHAEAVAVVDGTVALVVGTAAPQTDEQRGGFLWLVDTTTPEGLAFSPPVTLNGYPTDIDLTTAYAYVTSQAATAGGGGLDIISTQPFNTPTLAGTLPNASGGNLANARAVAVAQNVAYVARLGVVDISNPAAPVLLTTDLLGGGMGRTMAAVQVVGDILYTLTFDGLRLLDIRNPAAPTLLDQQRAPLGGFDLVVGERWAYIGSDMGLSVYDPTPFALAAISRNGGAVGDLALADGVVYTGGGGANTGNVQVFAAPADGPPARLRTVVTEQFVYDMQVNGDVLAVAQRFQLAFWQRNAAHTLPPIGTYPVNGLPLAFQIVGDRAYLLEVAGDAQLTTLHVLDLRNLTAPAALSVTSLSGIGYFTDLAVVGTTAYLVGPRSAGGQMAVFDLSDPTQPTAIGTLALDAPAAGIVIDGSQAYVVGDLGLAIVDISNAPVPALRGVLPSGAAQDVVVTGTTAYLATGERGVQVVDVSEPTAPMLVTSLTLPGTTMQVQHDENRLYVATRNGGMQVIQLAPPTMRTE